MNPAAFAGSDFQVVFTGITLDPRSVVDQFLEPLLGDVLKYVDPVRPIIDELYAPIPLVSDAMDAVGISQDQWPTWIGLLELASGNKLEMLDRVAEVSQFLDTHPVERQRRPADPRR